MKRKKSIGAILLSLLMILTLCPLTGTAAETAYTLNLTAEADSVENGEDILVAVIVNGAANSTYDYVQMNVTYSSTLAEYDSASAADGLRVSQVEPGKLLITAFDQNKTAGTLLTTLTFKAKALGTAVFAVETGALAGAGECVNEEAAIVGSNASVTIEGGTDPLVSTSWYGEDLNEFTLTKPSQLAGLAQLVNNGTTFSGKTVKLGDDLDLSAYTNWTAIGTNTVTADDSSWDIQGGNGFAGTFDGQNHVISNLKASDTTGGVALFGYATGTLKNFTLSGEVKGNHFTAGVCAYGCGVFENITNNAAVIAKGNGVGGILGDASGIVTIKNCHNTAAITNEGTVSEKSTGRAAGILGCSEYEGTIENCSNSGNITAYQYVAGILGGSFANVSVVGCCNTGTITGISFGKVYLGGIVGKLEAGTVDSCYNQGAITDQHTGIGHIRSVGGIAGSEEGHAEGTAISHCYNTGLITLNTENMTEGTHYIYMAGAISGGNRTSDANEMTYEDCFYLEDCFPAQKESDSSYKFWSDVYKEDHTAYDTVYVQKKTEAEMKSQSVLTDLGSKFKENPQGGYLILYWEDGSQAPEASSYSISKTVTGGTADVSVVSEAKAGDTVDVTVSNLQSGKQIKSVKAKDVSGAEILVSEKNNVYSFLMPGRSVAISVTLENVVAPEAQSYSVRLPLNLDGIWKVTASGTYYDESTGKAKAGSTVAICVSKAEGAALTGFSGVTVKNGTETVAVTEEALKKANGVNYKGDYTFTMPDAEVTVELNVTYSDFKVYEQKGTDAAALKKTYTRDDMLTLAGNSTRAYYSGWSTETIPFIGVMEKYVSLADLLSDTNLSFEKGDRLVLNGADGFSQTVSYSYLMGTDRYYYSDILSNGKTAADKTKVSPAFVIRGVTTTSASDVLENLVGDTMNAYRFVYGQTESDLTSARKIVDSLPKCVSSVTLKKAVPVDVTFNVTPTGASIVVKDSENNAVEPKTPGGSVYTLIAGESYQYTVSASNYKTKTGTATPLESGVVTVALEASGSSSDGKPDTSGLDLTSSDWDGKTVDVSWYLKDKKKSSYRITTAAQLAGAAALINGLVNEDCKVYLGNEVWSASKWNSSEYVNSDSDAAGANNEATETYHYGVETFQGKTIELGSDLDMTEGNYMPLGGQYLMTSGKTATKISASFSGMFDGNEHTVSISCDRYCSKNYGDGQSVGFIGRLGAHDEDETDLRPSGAGVKDLIIEGSVKGNRSVGGVVGKIGKTKNGATISGCANFASVTGTDAKGTGGICGSAWNGGTIKNCYNSGAVKNTYNAYGGIAGSCEIAIVNCYNIGKISGKGTSAAIATSGGGDTYDNCYWLEGTADMGVYDRDVKQVEAKTKAEMQTSDFVKALGSAFAADTDKVNGGYPVFKWQASSESKEKKTEGETTDPAAVVVEKTGASFADVASSDWFYPAVSYVVEQGLMNGMSENTFAPGTKTTRAMLMTILARKAGADISGGSPWYQKSLDWAKTQGISDGTNPEAPITREQLAVMLYRAAGSPAVTADLNAFSDQAAVSGYAKAGLIWAVEKGIVNGKGNGILDPRSDATRAELAMMLMRYCQL